jgi:hypothetical protein
MVSFIVLIVSFIVLIVSFIVLLLCHAYCTVTLSEIHCTVTVSDILLSVNQTYKHIVLLAHPVSVCADSYS